MKKKYIFFTMSIFYVISTIILVIIIFNLKDNQLIINNNSNNPLTHNNALTMMLETDIDSNEYEVATSNEWPQEGYIFNAEMSACERGGSLSWDNENNRVVMASGSADKCYVYFDRYTTVRITNVTASNITNNSITLTVEATTEGNPIATYYFSNDDGLSYEESTSNTYTFNNLSTGIKYNFQVYAVDTNGISSNVYTLKESTLSTVYLADYIKNTVYTGTDGDNGLYYHDGVGNYTNASQEAGDYSYRYSGANPNNYVCFGSDEEICPVNNLYRIIGVFGENVKLIMHDYATNTHLGTNGSYNTTTSASTYSTYKGSLSVLYWYYWNRNGSNTWSQSNLNTINLNVNYINYLNEINSKWNEMIETINWKVGGTLWEDVYNNPIKEVYALEIGNSSSSTTYNAKIGLMYVSDYGYAASSTNWTINLGSYDNSTNTSNNWLYLGANEWIISRLSDYTNLVFLVDTTGRMYNSNVNNNGGFVVRPVFYLKSNVAITSGTGTSSDPYRITIS